MSLQRLIVTPEQFSGNHIHLTSEQQHYLRRVLRLAPNQPFLVLDGQGGQWLGTLTDTPELALLGAPQSTGQTEDPLPAVTLAIAIPKGGGFDDLVRQTTELGVAALQPILTQRTLLQPSPKKLERWQRIAAEATEQSERLWLPKIYSPLTWAQYLSQAQEAQRYLCVARQSAPHLLTQLQSLQNSPPPSSLVIATGPEGGWTLPEIDQARQAEFIPVSLGKTILRAVTAPLTALAVTMAVFSSATARDTSE